MVSISVTVDRSAKLPLQRQLYDWLRAAILTGRFPPGAHLPPSRELAEQLGVSRTTVVSAYERLITDGYLQARVGSATSVAHRLPAGFSAPSATRHVYGGDATPKVNGAWLEAGPHLHDSMRTDVRLPYRFHLPFLSAVDAFPLDEWRRLVADAWRTATTQVSPDCSPGGALALRREIVSHVRVTRGIECDPGQVIITNSNQQSVDLLCRVLLQRGDRVAVEDPCRPGLRDAVHTYGADCVPLPVDDDGLVVEKLRRLPGGAPRLVHVTPERQYPTGAVLSSPRRLELLAWAAEHRALLLEDANGSELTYEGSVAEALQAVDTAGVVAYLGTFTEVLIPSIQIGYLIVPAGLVPAVLAAHRLTARPTDVVHQRALASFMQRGGFARHLRRLRRFHLVRRNAFIAALRQEFGDEHEVVIGPAHAGMDIQVCWPVCPITTEVVRRARAEGIGLLAVRPMYVSPPGYDPGVSMAYASLDERTIKRGVALLADVLRTVRP